MSREAALCIAAVPGGFHCLWESPVHSWCLQEQALDFLMTISYPGFPSWRKTKNLSLLFPSSASTELCPLHLQTLASYAIYDSMCSHSLFPGFLLWFQAHKCFIWQEIWEGISDITLWAVLGHQRGPDVRLVLTLCSWEAQSSFRHRGSVHLWWSLRGTCHLMGEFTVHSEQMESALFVLPLACICASLQYHCRTLPQLLRHLGSTDWSSQGTPFTTHTEASPCNRPLSLQGSWEDINKFCWMCVSQLLLNVLRPFPVQSPFPWVISLTSWTGLKELQVECKPCYKLTGAKFLSPNPLVHLH